MRQCRITPPKVFFDFEFHFLSGEPCFVMDVEDGTWSARQNGDHLELQVRRDSQTVEEYDINLTARAYFKRTRREVPVDEREQLAQLVNGEGASRLQ